MAVIISELLCYLLAKIDSVPTDTLTRLVSENFSDSEVDAAKTLLCAHVEDSIKAGNKRGQHKKKHDLEDIVKMLVQCDRASLPRFVALDLAKLPPISIDCIDVSALMRKQQLQDVEISNLKDLVQEILTVTVETSKRIELGSPSYRRSSSMVAVCPEADSEASTSSSDPPEEPVPVTAEPSQGLASGPSYSEVARDAVANSGCAEWSVANRWKRAKAPAPRKPAEVAAAPSPAEAAAAPRPSSRIKAGAQQTARPSTKKVVIGSRTTGPIKAVAAVRRLSVFISRLPPGTGEDAIKGYVKEQTGADDVTASKLPTRYDSYESYRLDIVNPSCEDVLDPDLWAQGLVVRRFFTRRQTSDGQPAATADIRPISGHDTRN